MIFHLLIVLLILSHIVTASLWVKESVTIIKFLKKIGIMGVTEKKMIKDIGTVVHMTTRQRDAADCKKHVIAMDMIMPSNMVKHIVWSIFDLNDMCEVPYGDHQMPGRSIVDEITYPGEVARGETIEIMTCANTIGVNIPSLPFEWKYKPDPWMICHVRENIKRLNF